MTIDDDAQYEPTMRREPGGDFVRTATMGLRGLDEDASAKENDGGRESNAAAASSGIVAKELGSAGKTKKRTPGVKHGGGGGGSPSGVAPMKTSDRKSSGLVKGFATPQPQAASKSQSQSQSQQQQQQDGSVSRQRPTNNQLLYRINFNWQHYEHAIPASVRKALPKTTEACPSVTSAFLQTLKALDVAESQRLENPRNILQLLSVNTRRTKVVALNTGTHRVPEELRRHQLTDSAGNEYSTNLDRNRYGNDDNYLYTVTRFNLHALELCPLLAQVQIIGTKASDDDVLLSAETKDCCCGGRRQLSHHWTVPAFVTPSQMPKTIPKSTLAAKDRSRKRARQSLSSVDEKPSSKSRSSMTPDQPAKVEDDSHAGMGVLLDALTSVGCIPMSPAPVSRAKQRAQAPVMSPARPVRGIRQVELDLGAINEDTSLAQEQIARATSHSIDQIPDNQLRNELQKAIARSCELHMTASAAQMRQKKAEREAGEYKVLVERLEQMLQQAETQKSTALAKIAKMERENDASKSMLAGNENDRTIQCSAVLAHKLINMQQRLAALTSRFELFSEQNLPMSVTDELLRTELASHLETKRALMRAETSLAAYAAAEATCDEEIWRAQYIAQAQHNLEQAAYAANAAVTVPKVGVNGKEDPSAPVAMTPMPRSSQLNALQVPAHAPNVTFSQTPSVAPPKGIKSVALMADAVATAALDASHLNPKTPVGSVRPMRHAFISPP